MPTIFRVTLAATCVLACALRPGTGLHPVPDNKRLFEPYPEGEVAGVKDPHDYKGKALCQRCHRLDGKLTAAPNALCAECHRFSHGNHPVDVVQKAPVRDLPLLAGGRVACHTCHDPHQKNSVLRMRFNELCLACHPRH